MTGETNRLTTSDLKMLAKILDAFEELELETRTRNGEEYMGGLFAEASMTDYDDETIDISLESGHSDENRRHFVQSNHTLDRIHLKSNTLIQTAVESISN